MSVSITTKSADKAAALAPTDTVPIQTSDDQQIEVRVGLLLQCGTFRRMYEDLGMADGAPAGSEPFVLPVPATAAVMNKVIDWIEEHDGVPAPVPTTDPSNGSRRWFTLTPAERRFLDDRNVDELLDYVTAANFLDLQSLYLYGCQSLATLVKDKNGEQFRIMLGLEDDLTREEKEQIRRDNIWCEY